VTTKQFYQLLNPSLKQVAKTEQQVLKPEEAPIIRQSSEDLINHLKYEEGSIYDK
jgi:hypothetical protein